MVIYSDRAGLEAPGPQAVERAVIARCRSEGWTVEDRRDEHDHIDLVLVRGSWRAPVDVKADYKADKTGNLFWEGYHTDDRTGRRWEAWGRAAELQLLLFVTLPSGRIYECYRPSWQWLAENARVRINWRDRPVRNQRQDGSTYTTHGVAIPIAELKRRGIALEWAKPLTVTGAMLAGQETNSARARTPTLF